MAEDDLPPVKWQKTEDDLPPNILRALVDLSATHGRAGCAAGKNWHINLHFRLLMKTLRAQVLRWTTSQIRWQITFATSFNIYVPCLLQEQTPLKLTLDLPNHWGYLPHGTGKSPKTYTNLMICTVLMFCTRWDMDICQSWEISWEILRLTPGTPAPGRPQCSTVFENGSCTPKIDTLKLLHRRIRGDPSSRWLPSLTILVTDMLP